MSGADAGLGFRGALGGAALRFVQVRWDGRKVERWLRENTSTIDTHRSVVEISTGTRLPEGRVAAACLHHRRIFRSPARPDRWSVHQADEHQDLYILPFGQ